jgi:hypothetical protein
MEWDVKTVLFILFAPATIAGGMMMLLHWLARGRIDQYFHKKRGEIDSYFAKRLKRFEHRLSRISASAQFDYQRKLHDFTLYTEKRHSVYAEFYAGLRLAADESLTVLLMARDYDDFEIMTDDVFRLILTDSRVSPEQITTFTKIASSLTGAERAKFLNDVVIEAAQQCVTTHRGAILRKFTQNELYFSAEARVLTVKTISHLQQLNMDTLESVQPQIFAAIQRMREQMQREMSVGDYSPQPAVVPA